MKFSCIVCPNPKILREGRNNPTPIVFNDTTTPTGVRVASTRIIYIEYNQTHLWFLPSNSTREPLLWDSSFHIKLFKKMVAFLADLTIKSFHNFGHPKLNRAPQGNSSLVSSIRALQRLIQSFQLMITSRIPTSIPANDFS